MDVMDVTDEDVYCDKTRLNQVLLNLLSNAIKFTPAGGTVSVRLKQYQGTDKERSLYEIRVKDTGCGIPEDCQEQIFERFYRVDKARSRETGGTGLGLAITRNVILMHKGSIRVHSKEGEGSTFIIRIPLNYIG